MNQISNAANTDRGASDVDAIRRASEVDAIAVSEKAKQQIGSQASTSKAKLQGPTFWESL